MTKREVPNVAKGGLSTYSAVGKQMRPNPWIILEKMDVKLMMMTTNECVLRYCSFNITFNRFVHDSSSNCLENVTFLTPSVASSTGLTSRSVFVSSYMRSRASVHPRVGSLTYLSKYCIPVSSIDSITPPFCRIWRSVHSSDEHCNHWPSGICVRLSCCMEQSYARTPWQKLQSDDVPEETENLFIQNQLVNSCVT